MLCVKNKFCLGKAYLSILLWIIRGGSAQELSKEQLIVNCLKATSPRNDVFNKARKLLAEVQDDEIKKNRFESLIKDQRAAQRMMDASLGVSKLVSINNLDFTLEKMKEEIALEEKEKFLEAIAQKDKEHEALIRKAADEQASIVSDYQNLSAENESLLKDRAIIEESAKLALKQSDSKTKETVDKIVSIYLKGRDRTKIYLNVLTVVTLFSIALGSFFKYDYYILLAQIIVAVLSISSVKNPVSKFVSNLNGQLLVNKFLRFSVISKEIESAALEKIHKEDP